MLVSLHSPIALPSLPSAMTGGRAVSREEVRFHGDTISQITQTKLQAKVQPKDAGGANGLAAEQTPPTQNNDHQVQITNRHSQNLVEHQVLFDSSESDNFCLGESNCRDRVLFATSVLNYVAPTFTNRILGD